VIEFLENDDFLDVAEIEKFIEENDVHHVFDTRFRWHENFVRHWEQLIAVDQIVTFRNSDNDRLMGLCSYCLVDNENKRHINKAKWTLPENISKGDIFYFDVCLLKTGASMFKIKKYLSAKYKSLVKQVFWFNAPSGRWVRINFKGGVTCQTAA
jgi:hypothetical protein